MPIVDDIKEQWTKWIDLSQPQKVKALRLLAIVSFFLFFLLLIVYNVGSVKTATISKEDLVVFLETNPEDLLTLRYLLKRSDVHVAGVVVALNAWNSNLATVEAVMSKFLQLLRAEGCTRAASLPVFYGNAQALRNDNFNELVNYSVPVQTVSACSYRRVWQDSYLDSIDTAFSTAEFAYSSLAARAATTSLAFYAPWLKSYLQSVPARSVTALCLSSLTDITWFTQRWSATKSAWRQVVVSGGTKPGSSSADVQVIFSPNTIAELNFFFDPNAADAVIGSTATFDLLPVVWVPIDASINALDGSSAKQLLTDPAASYDQNAVRTSRSWIANMLQRKRTLLSDSNVRLPNDLLAAVLMSETSLRSAFGIQAGSYRVLTGSGLSLDGGVVSAAGKTVAMASSCNVGAVAGHLLRAENAKYPKN